jgi:hypothetical protein
MTKVGFIKELQSGDPIIVPGGGREPLRLSGRRSPGGFPGAADLGSKSDKVLRALVALRKPARKN